MFLSKYPSFGFFLAGLLLTGALPARASVQDRTMKFFPRYSTGKNASYLARLPA
jgi:hypothetical protein